MWLHVPTECCPTVPASADWSSESGSLDQALAASATLRGKSLPPRSWRRVCETGRFTRLLSGLTSPPSTAALGVASWIASLQATPASPTPSPESSSARTTTAGCSITSSASSPKFGLIVSSAKTSLGTRTDNSQPSSRHWRDWVTALRLESSQREKPGPTTSANDSSSWPTLSAESFEPVDTKRMLARRERLKGEKNNGNGFGLTIGQAVAVWPTPVVLDRPRSPETLAKCADFRKRNANQNTVPLYLGEVAQMWETPSVAVTEGSRLTRGGARADEKLLTGQAIEVSSWPTPAARDYRGGGKAVTREDGKTRMDMLDWKAERGFSLPPAPQILHGSRSSDPRRISLRLWLMSMSQPPSSLSRWVRKVTRRKLNPSFVDWMHGWPNEWTDCERAVTAFRPWLLRSRGELSKLLTRPTANGQLNMFD